MGVVLKSSTLLQLEGTLREDIRCGYTVTIWIRKLLDDNFILGTQFQIRSSWIKKLIAVFHENFKLSTYCTEKIQFYALFYQQLKGFWQKVRSKEPLNAVEIVNQIIGITGFS